MELAEHKQITTDILQQIPADAQAKISELLTKLTTDYTSITADMDKAVKTAEKMTLQNEELRQANMNLFLQIGQQPSQQKQNKIEEKKEEVDPFKDLFDKNGNLKL